MKRIKAQRELADGSGVLGGMAVFKRLRNVGRGSRGWRIGDARWTKG